METKLNSEELIRLKAYYQLKYGYEADNFTASFLNEIKERFEERDKKMYESMAEINANVGNLNVAKRHIYFTKKSVGFWYAFGISAPFCLTITIALFLIYSGFIYVFRRTHPEKPKTSFEVKKPEKHTKSSRKRAKNVRKRPKTAIFIPINPNSSFLVQNSPARIKG